MAKPTKFSATTAGKIVERLRAGCTRKASAESGQVCYHTFRAWLEKGERASSGALHEFAEAVRTAEADAEVRMTAVVQQAALGYDGSEVHESVTTEIHWRKTVKPDGTVIEEPVTFEVKRSTRITRHVREPKMAIEWLKRLRRTEWGDRLSQEHSGPDGGPIPLSITSALDEAYGDRNRAGDEEPDEFPD